MGIDRLGIVSILKKSKNKQIFIDWVRNDQVEVIGLDMIVLEMIGLYIIGLEMIAG